MYELQQLPQGSATSYDGMRYSVRLSADEPLDLWVPAAPAYLRLRMLCVTAAGKSPADHYRIVVSGRGVADGRQQLPADAAWTSYYIPLTTAGRTQVTVEITRPCGQTVTSPEAELWVTSLAVVDSVTKERDQRDIDRSRLDMEGMISQLKTAETSAATNGGGDAYLADVQTEWETFAKEDPLFYILTEPDKVNRGWDPDDFYQRGEGEIAAILDLVDSRQLPLARGRALDFGCGVGRLTQALARHFDAVDGVDISPSMVSAARLWNQFGNRVSYHVNPSDDLALFADNSFDFIYSSIVLQHVRPQYVEKYIAEFMRILRPGGVLLFQMPSTPRMNSLGIRVRFMPERMRVNYVSRRASYHGVMEIHWIHRRKMVRLLRRLGAVVEEVQHDHSVPDIRSCRYCVRKPGRTQRSWGIHQRRRAA